MCESFDELNQEQEKETWQLLTDLVPALAECDDLSPTGVEQLLSPPIHEKLATYLLMSSRMRARSTFLTDEQLHDIASEEMKAGRVHWETNIDEIPGIYVFVSLVERLVYKVGESANLRERITNGHLRYGNQQSDSNLVDYCKSMNESWPQCIREKELTAVVFPVRGSCTEERQFLEFGLQKLVQPLMP